MVWIIVGVLVLGGLAVAAKGKDKKKKKASIPKQPTSVPKPKTSPKREEKKEKPKKKEVKKPAPKKKARSTPKKLAKTPPRPAPIQDVNNPCEIKGAFFADNIVNPKALRFPVLGGKLKRAVVEFSYSMGDFYGLNPAAFHTLIWFTRDGSHNKLIGNIKIQGPRKFKNSKATLILRSGIGMRHGEKGKLVTAEFPKEGAIRFEWLPDRVKMDVNGRPYTMKFDGEMLLDKPLILAFGGVENGHEKVFQVEGKPWVIRDVKVEIN